MDLPPEELAVLAYVENVTLNSARLQEADLNTLRNHGYSDEQILEITMIAAWFAFCNRMANALGAEPEAHRYAWCDFLFADDDQS